MKVQIEESWRRQLQEEFDKPYFEHLVGFVKEEYARYTVFPPGSRIFHAYNTCPFEKVKVVILGQDPYHEPGQYYGLCFSVMDGVPFPPSLVNIFKEIQNDLGKPIPCSGRLERWADQGVLLINAILTVRAHQAGSHQGKGWEEFTDAVIRRLNDERDEIGHESFDGCYSLARTCEIAMQDHIEQPYESIVYLVDETIQDQGT